MPDVPDTSENMTQSCSAQARMAQAPLYGTVEQVDLWVLIEQAGPWGAKALTEEHLPEPVRDWIARLPARIAALAGLRARVQLIAPAVPQIQPGCRVIVARSDPFAPAMVHTRLPGLDAVAELSVEAVAGLSLPGDAQTADPQDKIILVCTNGARDECCARLGKPVLDALEVHEPGQAWHTTHVGGHRYAANVLCLPQGVMYGYVMPEEAPELVEALGQGLLSLRHLRGFSGHSKVVQAADWFLRKAEGQHGLTALRLLESEHNGDGLWRVRFEAEGHTHHDVRLYWRRGVDIVQASCGEQGRKAADRFELQTIELWVPEQ